LSGAAAAAPSAPAASAAPAGPAPPIPWLGLLGVLLGTFISTLTSRLSVFGLNDVRGAIHAGFDEGAWITTAFTTAQMLITPIAVWVGSIYGPRPILVLSAVIFALSEAVTPCAQNLDVLLALQFINGLASGCFIPLTLSFILRNMPMPYWAYGIVLYALNLELSLNISASLEGWYIDNLSWHWIFWQNVPLGFGMAACLFWGAKSLPPPPAIHRDIYGLLSCGVGFADWLNSGLIVGLILAGLLMLVAFVIHNLTAEFPWLDFKAAFRWPMPLLLGNVALLRLTILTTAFLIPYYLGGVRGYRALQVGDTLVWIAMPQFLVCPLAAFLLRRFDSRMVFAGVLNLRPQDALTFGAMLQFARLFGGEIGTAFVTTEARVREQHASNLLGQHIQSGNIAVQERLLGYGHLLAASGHPAKAAAGLLANMVRTVSTVQATIDTYAAVSVITVFALFSVAVLLPPPPTTPASHRPIFKWRRSE
jgi:DHA2 family multidrug resistance protein